MQRHIVTTSDQWHELWDMICKFGRRKQEIPHEFPRFPGKRAERVDDSILAINLGCLRYMSVRNDLALTANYSAYIWTFFGYLRCIDSLSELEFIGRSNQTWPASPVTDLGRTVLTQFLVIS